MLNFAQYLIEMAAASSSEASDDKGKMHELLLAKYLNPNKDENGNPSLPAHHRAESENEEHSGTPTQVHKKLQIKMSGAGYSEIDAHAKQTAAALKAHLIDKGYDPKHLKDVHWTSNRDTAKKSGDHEKTTGIRDPNSNADLILTYKHPKTGQIQHVGISAKYGTGAEPNYRNDGLAALEKKSGIPEGTLTNLQKEHDKDMAERLGYTGTKEERHLQYKVGRNEKGIEKAAWKKATGSNKGFQPTSDESIRARKAEDASVEARKKMAREMDVGFGKQTDAQLRQYIRNQVSPKTAIPHVVAHSHVHDDGSSTPKIADMENIADEHLNNFKNIRVKPGNGIYTQFVGDYNGKERPVANQILKTASGPVKGSAGSFTLVAIPKKIKNANEPAKAASPMKIAAKKQKKSAPKMEPSSQENAMTNEGGREPPIKSSNEMFGQKFHSDDERNV